MKRPRAFLARVHWKSLIGGVLLAWGSYLYLQVSVIPDWVVTPLHRPDTAGHADAIVVLGAGYFEPCGPNLFSLRRTFRAIRLYREGRAPIVVFTGGQSHTSGGKRIAHEMGELARQLGVPARDILEETESTTTWENARNASALLRERGIHRVLLVTDGIHMRRAEACFRHFGFTIERDSVPQVCVNSSNLDMLGEAFHEYLGSLYYSLKGYTSEPPAASAP